MHLSSGLHGGKLPAEAVSLLLKQVTASMLSTTSGPSYLLSLASVINTESTAVLCPAEELGLVGGNWIRCPLLISTQCCRSGVPLRQTHTGEGDIKVLISPCFSLI